MDSFKDVIDKFGGPTSFGEAIGIEPFHAQTMKQRGSIPPRYWKKTVDAAAARKLRGVTLETLADMAERKAQPEQARGAA